jgi:hypothetical protein
MIINNFLIKETKIIEPKNLFIVEVYASYCNIQLMKKIFEKLKLKNNNLINYNIFIIITDGKETRVWKIFTDNSKFVTSVIQFQDRESFLEFYHLPYKSEWDCT